MCLGFWDLLEPLVAWVLDLVRYTGVTVVAYSEGYLWLCAS